MAARHSDRRPNGNSHGTSSCRPWCSAAQSTPCRSPARAAVGMREGSGAERVGALHIRHPHARFGCPARLRELRPYAVWVERAYLQQWPHVHLFVQHGKEEADAPGSAVRCHCRDLCAGRSGKGNEVKQANAAAARKGEGEGGERGREEKGGKREEWGERGEIGGRDYRLAKGLIGWSTERKRERERREDAREKRERLKELTRYRQKATEGLYGNVCVSLCVLCVYVYVCVCDIYEEKQREKEREEESETGVEYWATHTHTHTHPHTHAHTHTHTHAFLPARRPSARAWPCPHPALL